jgi:hypothetical protein
LLIQFDPASKRHLCYSRERQKVWGGFGGS